MYKGLVVALLLCSSFTFAQKRVAVRPHVTKKGTYVQPHQRTAPNKTQRDNWSSKPNVNPATGKVGTRTPKK